MIGIASDWDRYVQSEELLILLGSEILFAILMSHGVLSLAKYYQYYPDKEIPKTSAIFYRIAEIGCWLCLFFILIANAGIIFFSVASYQAAIRQNYPTLIFSFILFSLFLVQIMGGRRMIKTIRENARLQLENSFTQND